VTAEENNILGLLSVSFVNSVTDSPEASTGFVSYWTTHG